MNHNHRQTITIAFAVFITTLCIYLFSALASGQSYTPIDAHFNTLAKALLHGHIAIENPISTHDLTFYDGRWYVPFPPLPALLMLPFIAVLGDINTVLFSVVIGAVNTTCVFLLLQSIIHKGWVQIQLVDSLWLTALFGFGTVHWQIATVGSVWFLSQICTVTFSILCIWAALARQSPVLSGSALALAIWSRPHIILLAVVILGIGLQIAQGKEQKQRARFLLQWVLRASIPIVVSILLFLAYNYIRFDHIFDIGYQSQSVAAPLKEDLQRYGQFNIHFIPKNVWVMLLAPPIWNSESHMLSPDPVGMSLFLTSPALIYLFFPQKRSFLIITSWVSLGLILIPLLTYYNTGWYQFGYRFSLDFTILAIIMLAHLKSEHIPVFLRVGILLSIIVNAWGAIFIGQPQF